MNYANILVITSDINIHDQFNGATNKPGIRFRNIYENLQNKYKFHVPKMLINSKKLIELNIVNEDYIYFLEHAWNDFKENYDKDWSDKYDGIVPYHFCDYSNYKKIPCLYKQAGYFCGDVLTPIYSTTFDNSMMSANNCYIAVEMIDKHDLIYCLNMYPGHHAKKNKYTGYCYINNASIIAKYYMQIKEKAKIAILDLDYHAGDGQQEIFYEDPNVLTISIHADPKYDYPTYYGHADEIGLNEGKGFNENLIFPNGCEINDYLVLLEIACTKIKNFNPDILIIPFGADTFIDDPENGNSYLCCLQLDDYYTISSKIKNLNKKIIITQEGGYNLEKAGTIVENFLKGFQ